MAPVMHCVAGAFLSSLAILHAFEPDRTNGYDQGFVAVIITALTPNASAEL
jgi:hypothetical protein